MIYLDSTTTITLSGLSDSSGNLIDDATVTATLSDDWGNVMIDITLTSQGSGTYSGNITPDKTTGLHNQWEYTLAITSVVSGKTIDYRQATEIAIYRGLDA